MTFQVIWFVVKLETGLSMDGSGPQTRQIMVEQRVTYKRHFCDFGPLPLDHNWDWSLILNSCNLPYNGCLWTKDPLPSVLYEWPLGWEWGMFEGILLECAESSVPVFHETSFPTLHCGKLWENCIAASEGEEMSSAYLGGWQNCSIKHQLSENSSELPNKNSFKLY